MGRGACAANLDLPMPSVPYTSRRGGFGVRPFWMVAKRVTWLPPGWWVEAGGVQAFDAERVLAELAAEERGEHPGEVAADWRAAVDHARAELAADRVTGVEPGL